MLSIRIVGNTPYTVLWPRTDDGIIAQAEAWIVYESARTAALQRKDPWLTQIETQLTAAKTARALAQSGEAARTTSSDAYRTALNTARALLEKALAFLKFKHADNLTPLEYRGWNVRHAKRGGYTVKMPVKDTEVIRLLETYVAYESTLGAAQVADPPLATLQALLVDISDLAQNRGSSRTQRTTNVFVRGSAVYKLKDFLQGAAVAICLFEFDGEVRPDLANWGYTVVAATPPSTEGEPPVDPPVEG